MIILCIIIGFFLKKSFYSKRFTCISQKAYMYLHVYELICGDFIGNLIFILEYNRIFHMKMKSESKVYI